MRLGAILISLTLSSVGDRVKERGEGEVNIKEIIKFVIGKGGPDCLMQVAKQIKLENKTASC